jgi:hypothetical protein
VDVGKLKGLRDVVVKLVKDVSLRGRVLDLEGRPIRGVGVRVLYVSAADGEDLGPWVKHMRARKHVQGPGYPRLRIDPKLAGLPVKTTTDDRGQFSLRGFGRERSVSLRFEGAGIEVRDVYALTREGPMLQVKTQPGRDFAEPRTVYGATFDHAAAPCRPIAGTVTDKDTGQPIPGVTIRSRIPHALASDDHVEARTDKEGRYQLLGLPRKGGQRVYANAAGQPYLPAGKTTGAAAGVGPARVDFPLKRGVVIKGKLTDKGTGKPARARVEYFAFDDNPYLNSAPGFRGSRSPRTQSAADGSFTVVGLPGRGLVVATVEDRREGRYVVGSGAEKIKGMTRQGDFITWPYIVNPLTHNALVGIDPPADAKSLTCNLALDPGKTVTGTVVGPDGKPVPGVLINGSWGAGMAQVGPLPATGKFTLKAINPLNPRPFFFRHAEKKLGAAVLIKGDEPSTFQVRLQPCATITGRVLDPDGEPLAGKGLAGYVEDGQLNVAVGWAGFFWGTTGKDGRFRIEGLIPGLKVGAYLSVSPARLGDKVFQNVSLEPGKTRDVGTYQVKPGSD